ncbi:MAG: hypothetical protein A2008_05360 [Candidatus Wallbacteria bacterium GWC2_49_35]|uniref:Type II secretion system protein GspG C-terminal domain-containing protein n=1 Tax=Candidatus Wallbacteria bacterium GWC2_49_35 TaxID=1817813 RepID=A0A1F7WP68_9BACT|nr:MAG: hypothetical protein A2008_05360 [Candidatus Wallbacteria bacterium GWC2_49_35]HBC74346.1 hypothetical protein [Candidatus Wallbacteria bacterium]
MKVKGRAMKINGLRLKNSRNEAFSLIELLVALIILGVLTNFAAFYYSDMRSSAAGTKVKADLMEIKKAISNFMSDEYNVTNARPANLSELVEKTCRAKAILDAADKTLKTYPMSADIEYIMQNEYADKAGCKTGEVDLKRFYLEKIPLCPWGEAYYADLYYVCARNPDTGYIAREPYLNPSMDKFYNGVPAPTFYKTFKSAGATLSGSAGQIVMSSSDATNKNSVDAMFLSNIEAITTLPLPDRKVTFEFSFKYSQKTVDDPVLNAAESRILETASGETYVPCANGMLYFFKDPPAAGGEAAVMAKSGFGLKFSAVDWELYECPGGAAAQKLAAGGWEQAALHSVKFVFTLATKIDCYIDGDLKATAAYSTASPVSKVYFAVSPDFFTSLKMPPPPYPPIPVLADCELKLHHVTINKIDFSKHYIAKIPSK